MRAYKCLKCGCIHGWIDHPLVTRVTRHSRYPGEDVWYCPNSSCDKEHRTTDGTMFGQLRKLWEVVDPDEQVEDWVIVGDGFRRQIIFRR